MALIGGDNRRRGRPDPLRGSHAVALLTALLAGHAACAAAQSVKRFEARLADGQRLEGERLTDWLQGPAQPRLDEAPLLDPERPLRWLRDRRRSLAGEPDAFVETLTGDRLPGTVRGFAAAAEHPYESLPDHLLVEPGFRLAPPQAVPTPRLRVDLSFLRRVVWKRLPGVSFQPGTVFYRDGRSLSYRAVRFDQGHISLLLEQERRDVDFEELAEIHLAETEFWDRYLDELAVLVPQGDGRLLQLETSDGLRATTSLDRYRGYARGNAADWQRWVHAVQPAWCLDALWIPSDSICLRRSFAPFEVPLSRVPPEWDAAPRGRWRCDRNLAGGPLRSGGQEYGWGFGVHASGRLRFALPPLARSFRCAVGIDAMAGTGGCLRARVLLTGRAAPLYTSPVLVGSQEALDTGPLELPGGPGQVLELDVDAQPGERPTGADPLEIRDFADWLDPLLELDAAGLRDALSVRAARQVPAWQGWSVEVHESEPAAPGAVAWSTLWDDAASAPGRFQQLMTLERGTLALSRTLRPRTADRWLLVGLVRRASADPPPRVEVRLHGVTRLDSVIPQGVGGPDFVPLYVPLEPLSGRAEVPVEVRLSGGRTPLQWRVLGTARDLPMVREVLEDDGTWNRKDQGGRLERVAIGETDDCYSGRRALRIAAGQTVGTSFAEPIAIRERPAPGEFRYARFAVRMRGAGQARWRWERAAPDSPAAYRAGPGTGPEPAAISVWSEPLADRWVTFTRDLHADFGHFDTTALTISVAGGESALVDHIYLARTLKDFDEIAVAVAEDLAPGRQQQLLETWRQRLAQTQVLLELGQGRQAAGVLIGGDGQVLTAAHVVERPDQPVTVLLPGGQRRSGRVRGICRAADWALVQLEGQERWPFLEVAPWPPAPREEWALVLGPAAAAGQPAPLAVVRSRRQAGLWLWTRLETPGPPGSPLLSEDGRLLGILSTPGAAGWAVYSPVAELPAARPRLADGEVWGQWSPRTSPWLGLLVAPPNNRGECLVREVEPGSPAAEAGLRVGELLAAVEQRPIRSAAQLAELLATRQPGDTLVLQVEDPEGRPRQVRVRLVPARRPSG